MKLSRTFILYFVLAALLLSCGNRQTDLPDYVVEKEKLVPLLVDIHLTDAFLNKEKKPHSEKYDQAIKMYPAVLLKHDIDRRMFDSTIRYYVKYPKEFALIYDEVLRELSILEGSVQKTPDTEIDSEE